MQYVLCTMHYALRYDGQHTLRVSHELPLYDLAGRGLCHLLADDAITRMVAGGTAWFTGGTTGLRHMAHEKCDYRTLADSTLTGFNHCRFLRISVYALSYPRNEAREFNCS
jgi:hypothetical protein